MNLSEKHTLEIDSVELSFGDRRILSGVYLAVETGGVSAVLGRNGCGKSCLMKILCGSLRAGFRSMRIDGVWHDRFRADEVRYLPQQGFIPGWLTLDRVLRDYDMTRGDLLKWFPLFEKLFGTKIPVKPIFRAGLNYQLADYSFIRASFGQGYRYPSLTEKYARKDIGGVGVYPNKEVNAEKGVNAELGFKQGYKFGNLTGFFDLAGFYTQYTDMIEFRFGIFNNTTFQYINGVRDLLSMITQGQMPGFGAQFYNVSKARIYGAEVSTNGVYTFNPNTTLSYNLGYVFIEPEDADYKKKNEEEATYDDPMQMKEKSNTSKYLKYRQKHTVKAILDFQWKRLTLGTNIVWKSKTLAVDYLMVDERAKEQPEIMDYVRDILFGNVNGQTLHSYWAKNNTPYCVVDLRAGVKIMKGLSFQFMVNNLFNKEYSTRPMLVSAPRTYVMQLSANF